MMLAPLTSLGLVSSHTNLLAMGQRRYAIKRGGSRARDLTTADAVDVVDRDARASCSAGDPRTRTTDVRVS
jgi:hypothetical protein